MVQENNIFHYILYFISLVIAFFSSPEVSCGDLLEIYAQKPVGLEFIECKKGNGQTLVVAQYKVGAEYIASVERFFVDTYGMGELEFVCCGWEPKNGKLAQPLSRVLYQLNPNYNLLITMHANAEIANEDGTYTIEKDRYKIDSFYVTVRIVDV